MAIIRTPEERFANLPGYPFKHNYIDINGLRVHYVDEGRGDPILCLHGEPSWSFLYRKMISIFITKHRAVAPDLIGFGMSDKYTERDDYTLPMHLNMLSSFIEKLDLRNITLVCQDWGGSLGLVTAMKKKDRFARLVIMNTGLPNGVDHLPEAFLQWRGVAEQIGAKEPRKLLDISLKGGGFVTRLAPEVMAAYYAPFPEDKYLAGVAKFPLLAPVNPEELGAQIMQQARNELKSWTKPALVMFSDRDMITAGRGIDKWFRDTIPGAKGQPEILIKDGGHFLQEDKGEEVAQHIMEFIERNPVK